MTLVSKKDSLAKWALLHDGRLHPDAWDVLRRFFTDQNRLISTDVKIAVKPEDWLPFRMSGRGSPTPAFVLFGVIYCKRSWLNETRMWKWTATGKEWTKNGDTADLSAAAGWGNLAHEIYHILQYKRAGRFASVKSIAAFFSGIIKSVLSSRKLWDHESVPAEREAIAFQDFVVDVIRREFDDHWFVQWEDYNG